MTVHMHPVQSSNITHVGYDPAAKRLTVAFKSGGIYDYDGVSPETHQLFMAADSKGKHFRDHISKLPFKKRSAP